ncbi:hypothetical protein CW304_11665 [Bacillus sp. UFRGS-B20]|nr:hypothetical protein CW304_11665 [Bacillus sp. UFRGS-B20]
MAPNEKRQNTTKIIDLFRSFMLFYFIKPLLSPKFWSWEPFLYLCYLGRIFFKVGKLSLPEVRQLTVSNG